jgi:hypothetical protein
MAHDNEKFAEDMRDAVKALMDADPYYIDIPIVTERLQDIDAKMDEMIQLTGGIALVLLVVTFEEVLENLPGANFKKIRFAARVIENLNLNATGKTAEQVALHTGALWSQLKPDALSSPLKLESVELGNDHRGVNYDTFAFTEGGTKITIPRLAELTIDASNLAAVAFAHETPGAFIFYTLDGSKPAPRNPAAAVYLNTFNSAPDVTVRARAWLPGYIPSAELRQVL